MLEHIPEDGDTLCIREISRVLKPGGRCVITIPFAVAGRDEFSRANKFYWTASYTKEQATEKSFFQRRYCEEGLLRRFVTPFGLAVKKPDYL